MSDKKIQIQIEAGTEELVKGLAAADKSVVKFSNNFVNNLSPISTAANKVAGSISGGFKSAFTDIAKGVAVGTLVSNGILGIAGAIKDFATGTVAAAEENENAINRLSQALRASGSFSQAAVSDFAAFADELERTSLFSAEAALEQIAFAKSMGATNAQAKNLVTAAANMAATFGGSLEENMQKLNKTLTGSAGKLTNLVPALKGLTAEQLRNGEAADVINSKYSGAAASQLDSYTGRLNTMGDAYGNLQEELGKFVTESDTVGAITGYVSIALDKVSTALADMRTENARSKEGFVETQESLTQLQRKFGDLATEIGELEAKNEEFQAKGFLGKFFTGMISDIGDAQFQLPALRKEIEAVEKQMLAANEAVNGDRANMPDSAGVGSVEDEAAQAKKEKALADQAALNEALIQQQAEFDAFRANLELSKTTLTDEQRAAEYEKLYAAEQAKVEAVRAAELEKAKLIEDAGVRSATINQINQKADLDRQKNYLATKDKAEKDALTRKKATDAGYLQAADTFLQAGMAVAKEGSAAMKAMQIVQATISTYTGATNALATVPYPANIAAAASIVALGLANVAKIAGAKFEGGGIVGGNSVHGDQIQARLNSREMVLNQQQQGEMFRQLKNGGGNFSGDIVEELAAVIRSTPIVVEANGREIARLVRDERANGFSV